ncbi:hypothetical protein ACJMK2_009263 [Sinanodonta woodiana]|uniref:Potassium channel domain-containing protein n=1 Tax=Sinanodonta woodiana TaxID=1069815 RepID=A0ABD3VDE3_SINWO
MRTPLFKDEPMEPLKGIKMVRMYGGLPAEKTSGSGKLLGHRLELRRKLIQRRRWIVDMEFILALTGIVLMIIETELVIAHKMTQSDTLSVCLKSTISATTVVLLICICWYYYIGAIIKASDAGVKEWQSVVTTWTWVGLFTELTVCAVHPIPGDIRIQYVSPAGDEKRVSIDAVLSILMMSRLYLIAKFAVVHSRLLTDTSTNSIGALSKIKINSIFVFKAAMSSSPSLLLLTVMMTTFIVNTWAMRTCEIYYEDGEDNTYAEIMWLVATTFLTIGYGDAVPRSYCGRYISVCTGIMGVGSTALLVAVLARKLEQTREEKYVFNMVSRIQIEKRRKTAAANVIKATLKLLILKKSNICSEKCRRHYEDQLKQSIRGLRKSTNEMAHVGDITVGFLEISETVNRIGDTVDNITHILDNNEYKTSSLEARLTNIEGKLDEIRTMLTMKRK